MKFEPVVLADSLKSGPQTNGGPPSNSIWLDADDQIITNPPVFLDQTYRRYNVAHAAVLSALGLLVAWIVAFGAGLYLMEDLAGFDVDPASRTGAAAKVAQDDGASPLDLMQMLPVTSLTAPARDAHPPMTAAQTCPVASQASPDARLPVFAHLPADVEPGPAALQQDCGTISVLMPEWYGNDGQTAIVTRLTPTAGDTLRLIDSLPGNAAKPAVLPVLALTFADAAAGAGIFGDPVLRADLVASVAALARAPGHTGICIAPTNLPPQAMPGFRSFFADLSRDLAKSDATSCIVTASETELWRDATIVAAADVVVFLAFKSPGAVAAPLADQAWFERTVAEATATIDPEKLVIALGSFGYDWVQDAPYPQRISYAEAMYRAALHGGRIELSPDALNSRISLTDANLAEHRIWLLDAVSLHNQASVLAGTPLRGLALWSVGYEDPAAFTALGPGVAPDHLEYISLQDFVGYDGTGPFLRIRNRDAAGRRELTADPKSGLIVAQNYSIIPMPYAIQRLGAGQGKTMTLTFDDGPDPIFTPQILDILRAENVPGAFFLIGSNILNNQDVVQRIVAEGHEIGNHTFFHPDIEQISDLRARFELNAEQRLLASVTGLRTTLFRTPYGRGLGPQTALEARALLPMTASGYVIVGSDIVPPDWRETSSASLVDFTLSEVRPDSANVIVLHDAGGDRSATVAALPVLISKLRAQGYEFVSLASLLGVQRGAVMPPDHGVRTLLDKASFNALGALGILLQALFWLAIVLGVLRSLGILCLALIRRHYAVVAEPYTAPVTVVIPAFNEESVILGCIETVLASDHQALRVIIIDDGSLDHTCERIESVYLNDPRVLILRKPNQGKWRALDVAYDFIETEFVVAIDADTVIMPDAISKLVRAFRDPTVGAVAGLVRVGNTGSLLTHLQALEYMTAQQIERRANEVFNGIMVVPGAIGAWRVEAVRKAGLYTNETLAEDADLTVSVLRAGYRVVFEEEAVSITEAPSTLRDFLKQRLRWRYGMMQTGWKHRRAAREGHPVGLISIPDLWLFGGVFALLGPITDLVLAGVLLDALMDFLAGRQVLETAVSRSILVGYLVLPLIDVVTILVACAFDRRFPTPILLIPFQRLFYRPLLYLTIYRVTWLALTGRVPGWGKSVRTGTVRLPEAPVHSIRIAAPT